VSNLKQFIAPFKVLGDAAFVREIVVAFAHEGDEGALKVFAKVEAAALKNGQPVHYDDGRKVWRETVALYTFDASDPDGGPIYEWHDDGDRVRHHRVEHTIHPDGRKESRIIRKFWAAYC
tara:strand:- start:774 stop:1133 length:360 start_codon:yes stop_codon:yes gene_type:complete